MGQRERRIEYLRGRIEVLKARKQTLLGITFTAGMDSQAREDWAEKLDTIIYRLRRYSAEIEDLEREQRRFLS